MYHVQRFVILLLLGAFVAGPALAVGTGRDARVRVVHASPDAPPVDVLVDGGRALVDIAFGEVTDYATLRAGEYTVEVVPAGLDGPVVIGPATLNLFFNRDYTVVALGRFAEDEIEALVLADDNRPASQRFARVRFVHASPDAPPVDIAVAGGPGVFSNVAFKGVGDYVDVPKGSYDLEVRAAGSPDAVLTVPGVELQGGTTYTVFATGLLSDGTLAPVVSVDAVSPATSRRARASASR